MQDIIKVLLYPLRGHALGLVFTFSMLLTLSLRAGIFGLPLAVVVLPWFFRYCFVVIEISTSGVTEAPKLSYENIAPFTDMRPAKLLAIIFLYYVLTAWVSPALAITIIAILVPAIISSLAIEDTFMAAVNPINLLDYIIRTGWYYILMAVSMALCLFFIVLTLQSSAGTFLSIFLLQVVLILMSHIIGRILYIKRDSIDHNIVSIHERQQKIDEDKALSRLAHERDRWYKLVNTGKHREAINDVLNYIHQHNDDSLYTQLIDEFLDWDDPKLGLILALRYIERLMSQKQYGTALDFLQRAHSINNDVRPLSEEHTYALANIADESGNYKLSLELLSDFSVRFPESQNHAAVAMLHARMLCLQFDQCKRAAAILEMLARDNPQVTNTEKYKSLKKQVESLL